MVFVSGGCRPAWWYQLSLAALRIGQPTTFRHRALFGYDCPHQNAEDALHLRHTFATDLYVRRYFFGGLSEDFLPRSETRFSGRSAIPGRKSERAQRNKSSGNAAPGYGVAIRHVGGGFISGACVIDRFRLGDPVVEANKGHQTGRAAGKRIRFAIAARGGAAVASAQRENQ